MKKSSLSGCVCLRVIGGRRARTSTIASRRKFRAECARNPKFETGNLNVSVDLGDGIYEACVNEYRMAISDSIASVGGGGRRTSKPTERNTTNQWHI